ncbi:MAG: hypothetical protein WA821_13060 [Anaerolineales bacterium]
MSKGNGVDDDGQSGVGQVGTLREARPGTVWGIPGTPAPHADNGSRTPRQEDQVVFAQFHGFGGRWM